MDIADILLFFGYANITSEDQGYVIKDPTAEQKALFGQYKQSNKEHIALYAKDKEVIDKTFHEFDVSKCNPETSIAGDLTNLFLQKVELFKM
mmetsp:Transcript_2100/g.1972  ORF Transcript_2100/g.1972 Transcript_2100/m.1972 type:complete len:92 (-) Transcript_2100:81-356(-)